MNPSQASLERAHALRQRTRPRGPQRPPEREEPPFPIVLRGYDRGAVDERVEELSRLLAELRTARSPQAAVRQALDRVGEETSAILQRAHETAEEITASARADAHRQLEAARRDADALRTQAERQARALASDSDNVWRERNGLIGDMRSLAENLLALADGAAERITKSPADSVRATVEQARTEADAASAETSTDSDPVAADEIPDDEPRVWREHGQATEQFDPLALEDEDERYDVEPEHASEPHGPYYS